MRETREVDDQHHLERATVALTALLADATGTVGGGSGQDAVERVQVLRRATSEVEGLTRAVRGGDLDTERAWAALVAAEEALEGAHARLAKLTGAEGFERELLAACALVVLERRGGLLLTHPRAFERVLRADEALRAELVESSDALLMSTVTADLEAQPGTLEHELARCWVTPMLAELEGVERGRRVGQLPFLVARVARSRGVLHWYEDVVLEQPLSGAELEAVRVLHAPRGGGAFEALGDAVAAARAL